MENKNCTNPININQATPGKLTPIGVATHSLGTAVLKACDELCGRKMGRRRKGYTWWLNEEANVAILRKRICTEGDEYEQH